MGVVVAGVSPHLVFWTAGIDHAILRNVIVVTDGVETTCLVAGFQGFYREVLVNTCGTAMYHNQIDFSWILHWILWILKDKCLILHTDLTDLTDFPFKMDVSLFYGLCYYMAI